MPFPSLQLHIGSACLKDDKATVFKLNTNWISLDFSSQQISNSPFQGIFDLQTWGLLPLECLHASYVRKIKLGYQKHSVP